MAEGGQVIYAVAKYDFVATDEQELSIKKTERLTVLDESSRWWKVQNIQGQSGIVPSNYLKKCKPSLLESLRNTLRKRGATSNISDQSLLPAKEDLITETFKAVAVYNYEAQKPDEMSLIKGDVVLVQKKSSDGWWSGWKENGQCGWFPSNYVKVLLTNSSSSVSLEERQKQTCSESRHVVALFSYNASNCDELSFNENEELEILNEKPENDACAKGWCSAQNAQGIIGLIPEAYVGPVNIDLGSPSNGSTRCNSLAIDQNNGASLSVASLNRVTYSDVKLSDKEWFIGKTTRAQCEQTMNQHAENGDFLVRESETHVGEYTLTMKTKQRIKHFRIKVEEDSGNYLIGQQVFHALDDLIDYYKKHAIYRLGNEKLFLNKAFVCKQSIPVPENKALES